MIFLIFIFRKGNKDKYRFVELPEHYVESLDDVYGLKKRKPPVSVKNRIWCFTDHTAQNYVKAVMKRFAPFHRRDAAKDKVPLNVIQKLLGHNDIKNTMIDTEVIDDERRLMVSEVWSENVI